MVAMINQWVKFILFDIIALCLVSWWSAKGKDDKMELYVVCSLILYHDDPPRNIYFSALKHIHALAYIMMISQGKMSRRGYMETAPWFVSQWSTKGKISSPKHNCSLAHIMMISQGSMSRWGHMRHTSWFVSQWSTKKKGEYDERYGEEQED